MDTLELSVVEAKVPARAFPTCPWERSGEVDPMKHPTPVFHTCGPRDHLHDNSMLTLPPPPPRPTATCQQNAIAVPVPTSGCEWGVHWHSFTGDHQGVRAEVHSPHVDNTEFRGTQAQHYIL